jgi:Transposase DDE domain
VLAIQDTSEIAFRTTEARRRELGDVAKGYGHGLLLHAMLALDAESGHLLGLTGGRIWTREERVTVPHRDRALEDKESERWLTTGERAKTVLAAAASVTVVADRESDLYAEWASLPGPNFHLLTRSMQDRRLVGGGSLYGAGAGFAIADTAEIDLRGHEAGVKTRRARLSLRFGRVTLERPDYLPRSMSAGVALTLIEVVELEPPRGHEPVHWYLLTTHTVHDAAAAWRIVGWYKQRWTIEQLFRVLKSHGLKLEDSQVATAERLIKLTAIATLAAATILQLVQARDGRIHESANIAFSESEIRTLDALNPTLEGKTALQKNPHQRYSLAWAAWIIAKLGGWDGYPSSRPPGPITFKIGLEYFKAIARGRSLKDV